MTLAFARPDVSAGAVHVWQRHRDVMLQLWKTELVGQLVEPFIVVFALGLGLGQFVELESGEDYVHFLAPGIVALFPMFAAVFECSWGSYVRLQTQGTFRAIIATPASVDDVITGELLWGMTRCVLNTTYIVVVAVALTPWLGLVDSPLAVLVIPLAVLPGFLFSAVSLTFVSTAQAMSQFNYFFNLVINPMFYFGGAFFPLDELPGWAQVLAWFLPLTHVIELYRGFLTGELDWTLLGNFAWLLVATAAFYTAALVGMRRRLIE